MKNRIRQNLWNRTGILMLKKTKNRLTCCCWSPRPRCRCLLRMPRTAASTWEWTLAPSARCNTGWTWKSTCPSSSREPPFCQIKAVLLFSLEFWYTRTTSVRLFFNFDFFKFNFNFQHDLNWIWILTANSWRCAEKHKVLFTESLSVSVDTLEPVKLE